MKLKWVLNALAWRCNIRVVAGSPWRSGFKVVCQQGEESEYMYMNATKYMYMTTTMITTFSPGAYEHALAVGPHIPSMSASYTRELHHTGPRGGGVRRGGAAHAKPCSLRHCKLYLSKHVAVTKSSKNRNQ
jgi:hypothetical protein